MAEQSKEPAFQRNLSVSPVSASVPLCAPLLDVQLVQCAPEGELLHKVLLPMARPLHQKRLAPKRVEPLHVVVSPGPWPLAFVVNVVPPAVVLPERAKV